jgi:pimeloyl-ACP methyl ester carboxylesterase
MSALALVCALLGSAMTAGCGDSGGDSGGGGNGGSGGGTTTVPPKPYVLVHGAFMGAWGWDSVAKGLEAKGAKVSVVELPAHGADMTPVSGATLDAYISKVSAAVDAAGDSVVLVGHSMGGIVISGVAEQKASKIDKLVYVAAFVPKDGDSLVSLASTDMASHLGKSVTLDMMTGLAKLPTDQLQDIFCADCTADEAASLVSHYRDEPIAPLATPVHVTAASFGAVPKYYFYTKLDNAVTYPSQQSMTAGVTFAKTFTFDTGHSPFLSKPDDVVATLLGL